MSRHVFEFALAAALALAGTVGAQDRPQTQPQTTTPSTQSDKQVAVEGCLMRKADVEGRQPSVTEKTGVSNEWVLVEAKIVKGASGQKAESSGKPMMFEVEGIDDEQLKQNAGKRVRIEGEVENLDRAGAQAQAGSTADLPQIDGKAIKVVGGECKGKM